MEDAVLSLPAEREQGAISFRKSFTKHKPQYFCQSMAASMMLQTNTSPKYDVFPRQEEFWIKKKKKQTCIPESMRNSPDPQFEQPNMSENKDQGDFKV